MARVLDPNATNKGKCTMIKILLSAATVATMVGLGVLANGAPSSVSATTALALGTNIRPARGTASQPDAMVEVAQTTRALVARGTVTTPLADDAASTVRANLPRGGHPANL